jgi:nitroimidazol reductase NimA-like FMN-containing flavoprotein (pyridoxamine 5'-phosphate oxidase superfamily)
MIHELQRIEIERVLRSEVFGHLGCHAGDRTYVVPMTYVYDGASIIAQTGEGQKVAMMRDNPNVCFEVDHVDADGAWESAIIQGRFEELSGEPARAALRALIERLDLIHHQRGEMSPRGAGRTAPGGPPGSRREVMFRIIVEQMTGRSETVPWIPEVRLEAGDEVC